MPGAGDQMQCMEVWGGSEFTSRAVAMGGLDAWIYSRPYGGARSGGDVYFASSCATGRINRVLLADVAGHGMGVARTASELRRLMRRYVNFLDQGRFVREMNRQFVSQSADSVFATALVTTFFTPTRRLSVCNAGHPSMMRYFQPQREWSWLEPPRQSGPNAQNIPLGILDLADYQQIEVELSVDDLVLCYTDALIESRDAGGEMLGEAGLLRIVRSLPMQDPSAFIGELLAHIESLHAGNLSGDDVTVLLLRPNGLRPRVSFAAKAGASVRMLGRLIWSLNPRAERAPLPDFRVANIGGAIFPPLARLWSGRKRKS